MPDSHAVLSLQLVGACGGFPGPVPPSVGLRAQEGAGEKRELLQVMKDSFAEAALGTPGAAVFFAELSQASNQVLL